MKLKCNLRSRRSAKKRVRRSDTTRTRCPAPPPGQARSGPHHLRRTCKARQLLRGSLRNPFPMSLLTCARRSALRARLRARRTRAKVGPRTTLPQSRRKLTRLSWSPPSSERVRTKPPSLLPAPPARPSPAVAHAQESMTHPNAVICSRFRRRALCLSYVFQICGYNSPCTSPLVPFVGPSVDAYEADGTAFRSACSQLNS